VVRNRSALSCRHPPHCVGSPSSASLLRRVCYNTLPSWACHCEPYKHFILQRSAVTETSRRLLSVKTFIERTAIRLREGHLGLLVHHRYRSAPSRTRSCSSSSGPSGGGVERQIDEIPPSPSELIAITSCDAILRRRAKHKEPSSAIPVPRDSGSRTPLDGPGRAARLTRTGELSDASPAASVEREKERQDKILGTSCSAPRLFASGGKSEAS
jgi:hypothetical protein